MLAIKDDNWVQRGSDIAATYAAGDVFGVQAIAGGEVRVYKNGTLVEQIRYTAFGEIREEFDGANVTDYEYTGELSRTGSASFSPSKFSRFSTLLLTAK